jgi:hypothetical protein
MAIPSFDSISQSIINNILTVNANVDVNIGSVVRDIFIDIQASELQTIYALIDFSSKAQSVLTAQGTQLDLLAYNYYLQRNTAIRSTGALTLVIKNGIQAPTLLNVGDQYYTSVDQTGTVYTFICAQTTLLTTGTVQAVIPIIALNPGAASNVPAYTITQCNYDFVDQIYNTNATSGGKDAETDAQFAARIPTAVTGYYINTYNGIQQTIFNIPNISNTPQVVTPDNPLSRGPYTVDVYLQRSSSYFGTPVQETAPANAGMYTFQQQPLYELNPINQITVFNPATNTTTVIPETLNGVAQYSILTNPTDLNGFYQGSVKAGQVLFWNITPPTNPYIIDYNVDQTIISSQSTFSNNQEVVSDVLFRQARATPIWVGASLIGVANTGILTVAQNAQTNIENMFSSLLINQSLTPNNAVYAFLQDSSVLQVNLTNFDTTYEIVLGGSGTTGNFSFVPTQPSATILSNHLLTPLGVYWENDVAPGPFTPFQVAGRLFIGNPDLIGPSGYNLQRPTNKTGVTSQNQIQGLIPSWETTWDTFYDSTSQTVVFTFATPPPTGTTPEITFNIVQPVLSVTSGLAYLTLAPDLVQPLVLYPGSNNTTTPTYATVLPDGLDPVRAKVYKNGLSLMLSPDGVTGDYQISGGGEDQNGVYTITFLVQPSTTDILQFGLLNPDLSISLVS